MNWKNLLKSKLTLEIEKSLRYNIHAHDLRCDLKFFNLKVSKNVVLNNKEILKGTFIFPDYINNTSIVFEGEIYVDNHLPISNATFTEHARITLVSTSNLRFKSKEQIIEKKLNDTMIRLIEKLLKQKLKFID